MHFGAGVVQRWYAQKYVVFRLAVVCLLNLGGMGQAPVFVEYRLGEAGGAAGKVYGGVVVVGNGDDGVQAGLVGHQIAVAFSEHGAAVAHVEQQLDAGDAVRDLLYAANELVAEKQRVRVAELQAVADLLGGVTEIQRHSQRAGLEHAEVYGQPLDAVHHEYGHLVALADATGQKQVGAAVGLFVEHAPGDLTPEGAAKGTLYELVFLPGGAVQLGDFGIQFHQSGVVGVEGSVSSEQIGNGHLCVPFMQYIM